MKTIVRMAAPLVMLFMGCTHSVLMAPLPVIDPGHAAEVVIIRPSAFLNCGEMSVMIDGRTVFTIECGQHVVYPIAAGDHVLATVSLDAWRGPTVTTTPVTVVVRERFYLRIAPSAKLEPIPPEEGVRVMTETTNFLSPAK